MYQLATLISLLQLASAISIPSIRNDHSEPIVNLGYSTYRGVRIDAGIDQYLGMRYAAPPLGNRRFRAPEDPIRTQTVQDANSFGPICVGTGQTVSSSLSEDCLFVNVFTPSNATPRSKLPVWVYIQGGGYATNSNANYNGTGVIQSSGYDLVFVNFNYRVGALGFLASEKVRRDGDLNAGLLDQRKVLEWVQKYIHLFGGDPNHVVIHGASAGAGSVSHHLAAHGGRNDHLFVGAVPESTFWPTQRTVPEMEFQFDEFVDDCGCSTSRDQLECLRSVNISTIQAANIAKPFPGGSSSPAPEWYFLPVTDGVFVTDRPYNSFLKGKFIKVPVLVGDDTDEGSIFAFNATSQADISNWFKNNYPKLSNSQLASINRQYPLMTPLPGHAAYFPSASAIYGDATFTCPGNQIAISVAQFVSPEKVWNYRYNVLDPVLINAGQGVPHTFETSAIFGPTNAGSADTATYEGINADIVPVVMDYWVSFVKTLNPNPEKYSHAPYWAPFGRGSGKRLKLQTNATEMEVIPGDLTQHCDFWRGLAPVMEV
ncbi:triacylglycerol lipase [Xylogone sp. PMI_703]|nr:triacylglycerol lipase [Xylogone sp. PMI_703]